MRIIFITRKPNPDWDRHLRREQVGAWKPTAKFAGASALFPTIKMGSLFINHPNHDWSTRSTQLTHPLRSLTTLFNRCVE